MTDSILSLYSPVVKSYMSDVSTTLGSAERDCASTQQYLSRTEEQLQGIDLFIMCCISAKIHRKAPSNNNLPRRKQSNLPQLRFPLWHILILFSTVDKLLASLIINIPTIKSYNMSSVSEKGQEGHLQQHSVYRRLCEDVDKLTSFLSLVRKKRPLFYLPECPLHDIFELLQPVDQACLSFDLQAVFRPLRFCLEGRRIPLSTTLAQ